MSVGGNHDALPEAHRVENRFVFGHEPLDKVAQPLKLYFGDLPLSGAVTGLPTPMTKKRRRRGGVIRDLAQYAIEE
jgi:hypothetical protein